MVRPTIRSNSIVKKRESNIYYVSTIIHKVMGIYWNLFANSIDMWNSTGIPQWIEKWFHTYEQHRYRYDSLEEFLEYYNTIKPYMSLDWDNLQTPEQAFWKKCRSDILGSYFEMIEKEVE